MEAVQLPEKVEIMNIKAHQKVSSELEEGNELADREAKEAAKGEVTVEGALIPNGQISLEENPSAVGLLMVEEQQVPIATSTVHRRQYRTTRDAVIPIHKMIRELETQGVVSKAHSPFNSPIWPVRKSDGEWRLTVD
ncbi:hypothetical protein DUI87_13408 [Hirundo rustica rustica]|uniref:RNase H type-1 domain-containing protein n=1 Tax=Hirundo rustica rustica TaxID=333673 RepID=A0A3M0K955_HIRRU|nr:hypothetical protein DUI87_13408 [Hirundo rustica rustica]